MNQKKVMRNIVKGGMNLFLVVALLVGGVVAEENIITEEIVIVEENAITEDSVVTEENVISEEVEKSVPEIIQEGNTELKVNIFQERVAESELVVDNREGNKSIVFDASTKTYFMGDYQMDNYAEGSVDLDAYQSGKYNQNTKIIVNGGVTIYTINGEVVVNSIREGDGPTALLIFEGSNLKIETNDVVGIDIPFIRVGYTSFRDKGEAEEVTKLQVKAKEIGILVGYFEYDYIDLVVEAEKFGITSARYKVDWEDSGNNEIIGWRGINLSKMKITVTGDDAIGIQMRHMDGCGLELEVNVNKGIGIYTDIMMQFRASSSIDMGTLKINVNQGEGIVAQTELWTDQKVDVQVEDGIGIYGSSIRVGAEKMRVEVQKGYGTYGRDIRYRVDDLQIITRGASTFSKKILEERTAAEGTSREWRLPDVAAIIVNRINLDYGPGQYEGASESYNWLISAPMDIEGSYGVYGYEKGFFEMDVNTGHKGRSPLSFHIKGNVGVFFDEGEVILWAHAYDDSDGETASGVIEGKKAAIDTEKCSLYSLRDTLKNMDIKAEEFGIKTDRLYLGGVKVNVEVLGDNAQTAVKVGDSEVDRELYMDNAKLDINSSRDGLIVNAGKISLKVSHITVQADDHPIEMNLNNGEELSVMGTEIVAIATQRPSDTLEVPAFNTNAKINLSSIERYASDFGEAIDRGSKLVEIYQNKTINKLSKDPMLAYSPNGNIDNYLDYEWKVSPEINFEVSNDGILTEEEAETIEFSATRQGGVSYLRADRKIQLQDENNQHVVEFLTYSKEEPEAPVEPEVPVGPEVPVRPEVPEVPKGGDSNLYTVNFYNCAGKLEGQDWVGLGETAKAPKAYIYPTSAMKNINSNRDIQPLNCDSQFTIPNTGVR